MIGTDAYMGKPLEGTAHLAQSIADILTTPIGSRVMRRDYGSLLFELIDAPFNAATKLLLYAATALALHKWEPRIRLTRVEVAKGEGVGEVVIALQGLRTDGPTDNELLRLTLPLRLRADALAGAPLTT